MMEQHSGHDPGLERFNLLENKVKNALVATSGGCASGAAAAVDAAVRRAHCKGRILGHLDSSLLNAAVDEVSCEIRTLQEAATANAAVMRQVLPKNGGAEGERGSGTHPFRWEHITSTATIPEDLHSAVRAAGGTSTIYPAAAPTPSSIATVVTEGSDAGKEESESTGASPAPSFPWESGENVEGKVLSAASIVAPLRQLAREVVEEEGEDSIDTKGLQQKLRLSRPKSGDMKMAREVDFDECASPRASFDATGGPFGVRSSRWDNPSPSFRMGSGSVELPEAVGGSPAGSPPTRSRHFLVKSPTSRVRFRSMSGSPPSREASFSAAAALGFSPPSAGVGGGKGQILTLHGDIEPFGTVREQRGGWMGQRPSPVGAAGLPICEDGAPPGLEPTARVEGSCLRGAEMEGEEGMLASAGAVSPITMFLPMGGEMSCVAPEVAALEEGVHRHLHV